MHSRPGSLAAILPYSLFLILYFLLLTSCSISKQISRSANILLKDSALVSGHVGISFYEPATGKTWYNHNANKYFIPASNAKLFSLYAGLKYLPDSLPALRYYERNDTSIIQPTGDPTFLHPDFKEQPALIFLQGRKTILLNLPPYIDYVGKGWAWDDYKEYYMAQRSAMPMYGNVINVKKISADSLSIYPRYFAKAKTSAGPFTPGFNLDKSWETNELHFLKGNRQTAEVPFRPDDKTIIGLLADTLHYLVSAYPVKMDSKEFKTIYSQLSDSLYRIMMHRSDNFFAEQTLLMASNEKLGEMDDGKMMAHILNHDLKDAPQIQKWVDGSGLSRYNLFTPKGFTYLLNKMRTEFGIERMKTILPTGGEGTLQSYYVIDKGLIYAKTGTLSNNLALSGYIYTQKNKLLIFSIMVNNFPSGATPVRKAIEKFVHGIITNY